MTDFAATLWPASVRTRNGFLVVLFLLTVSTVITFPLLGDTFMVKASQQNSVILLLGWLSTAHVATTAFYYSDREFIPHIRQRPTRYVYMPTLVLLASVTAWGLTKDTPYFWIPWQIYHAWLLWHFMRQNVGVSALAAQATRAPRLGKLDRYAIAVVGIGAIIGASRFGPPGVLTDYKDALSAIGLAIYLIGGGLGLTAAFIRVRRAPGEWVAATFLVASVLFFAPTFIGGAYYTAVMSFAIAHALQYWFLMSLLVIGSGRRSGWIRSIGAFAFLTGFVWLFIYLSRQGEMWSTWGPWVAGIGTGLTISHFVIDADSWRLRESFQRNYVMTRLGHLLRA